MYGSELLNKKETIFVTFLKCDKTLNFDFVFWFNNIWSTILKKITHEI